MKIRQMDRSGATARTLTRAGATALGLGMTAALTLSGCAQSDVGGSEGGTAATSSAPEESDMTSPNPSDGASGGAGEDGKLPQAADMEVEAGSTGRGLPPGLEGNTQSTAGVAWAPVEGLIYVVTNGSSSCPTYAEPEATMGAGAGAGKSGGVAAEDGVLSVRLLPPGGGVCTMDFVPTTTVVEVPAEVDTGDKIPVVLGDKGTVQLLPRAAEGEPGPVAWLDS